MLPKLSEVEARIIGCLMEKSVTTPDQYPLTLNALTNACNQKSAREPVMTLRPAEVQRDCRALKDRSLLHIEENFKTGVEKYKQRLCNTQFSELKFDSAQFAMVTLLLLRGAQTPGELRSRSGRLHPFADNEAVSMAASGLMSEDVENSIIMRLPRTPGRKDAEFMHQFYGVVNITADPEADEVAADRTGGTSARARIAELEQRIRDLEQENAALKARLTV